PRFQLERFTETCCSALRSTYTEFSAAPSPGPPSNVSVVPPEGGMSGIGSLPREQADSMTAAAKGRANNLKVFICVFILMCLSFNLLFYLSYTTILCFWSIGNSVPGKMTDHSRPEENLPPRCGRSRRRQVTYFQSASRQRDCV